MLITKKISLTAHLNIALACLFRKLLSVINPVQGANEERKKEKTGNEQNQSPNRRQNETKRSEAKRNETKQNKTKRNKTKQNEAKRNKL
jgi:hypothetical protein